MYIRCARCGTDSPSVIYYVGEDESHCGDCWSALFQKLINAEVNFNTDAAAGAIDREVKAQNCGPLVHNPEPEPGTIKVYSGAAEFFRATTKPKSEGSWFRNERKEANERTSQWEPHYNYGTDLP